MSPLDANAAEPLYHVAGTGKIATGWQTMQMTYLYLILAILFETFASSCMQASQQFTRFWPSLGMIVGFTLAFIFFMQVLKVMPLGVTYALWSGIGIVLISVSGYVVFGQKLDLPAVLGIGLIIAGTVLINFVSKTAVH